MSVTMVRKHTFNLKAFLFYQAITFAIAAIGALLGGVNGFEGLRLPPLTPPAAVFPIFSWALPPTWFGAAMMWIKAPFCGCTCCS